MKIALIGQDIPMLLPALLADLLFAGRERDAAVWMEEMNDAMREVLRGYGGAVFRKAGLGGSLHVSENRKEVLSGADCVLYAGDPQAASRFFQDRSALESGNEEDPGLTDQARVNGGIGGLLHTLRAGQAVLSLCDEMDENCPGALVINMGAPVARTTRLFLDRGYPCFGLGPSPLRGSNGVETMKKRLPGNPAGIEAETAGLPGFAFLIRMEDPDSRKDWLPRLKKAAEGGDMGRLAKRWLDWWGAIPAGEATDHAEFLPAQPDYIPEEKPTFGETVERRKERILYMNTVREKGAEDTEGAMAQLLLLSRVPPVRPVRLALALLRKEDAVLPAVAHRYGGDLPQLSREALVETSLEVSDGIPQAQGVRVTPALAEIMTEIDGANRLAARAAMGDREALREYVETDPALAGLDRLYCLDVVEKLIALHADLLPLYRDE